MKFSFNLSVLTLFIFIVSCGSSKDTSQDESTAQKAILVDEFSSNESASFTIEGIRLVKNELTITVNYSGGCEKHEFNLVGRKSIGKSLPPQRSIRLTHKNNDDSCRELVTESLIFNISVFAYGTSEIILNLEGYNEPIPYTLK